MPEGRLGSAGDFGASARVLSRPCHAPHANEDAPRAERLSRQGLQWLQVRIRLIDGKRREGDLILRTRPAREGALRQQLDARGVMRRDLDPIAVSWRGRAVVSITDKAFQLQPLRRDERTSSINASGSSHFHAANTDRRAENISFLRSYEGKFPRPRRKLVHKPERGAPFARRRSQPEDRLAPTGEPFDSHRHRCGRLGASDIGLGDDKERGKKAKQCSPSPRPALKNSTHPARTTVKRLCRICEILQDLLAGLSLTSHGPCCASLLAPASTCDCRCASRTMALELRTRPSESSDSSGR